MFKVRFWIWLVIALVAVTAFVRLLWVGFPLNTNVLDLLPSAGDNPVVAEASQQFSSRMGNQLIFLIGNKTQAKAIQSADAFTNVLEKHHSLFSQIHATMSQADQSAWGTFYFPYRLNLLTEADRNALQKQEYQTVEQSALMTLYSPMGISNQALFKNDPFFLFQHFILSLPKPAQYVQLHKNRLMIHDQHHGQSMWYVMITAELKGNSFSLSTQNDVLNVLKKSQQAVHQTDPSSHILQTGMLFYAKAGADDAQHDISTIGIGSLIGIILLMLLTFRSLSPLVMTLFSGVVGFICAFVVTQWVFGTVYLFTLAFGASLIGISVDYAFFFYADRLLGGANWNSAKGLQHIIHGISLGLLNIVLAYAVIAFTPFPGIQQLAVFAIVGLSMAFATVVCLFPLLLKARSTQHSPVFLSLTNGYLKLWSRCSKKGLVLLLVILGIVALSGLYHVHTNDDVRILEHVPQHLKMAEKRLKNIIGSDMGTNYFVVTGSTVEEVLAREQRLTHMLHDLMPSEASPYLALTNYLPSEQVQRENFALTQALLHQKLASYLQQVGVKSAERETIEKNLENQTFKPLTLQRWLSSPVSTSVKFLWLGEIQHQYASVVLLSQHYKASTLQQLSKDLSGVAYVNQADEISSVFHIYREKLSWLLGVAFILLLGLLTIRYGIRRAGWYVLPPVMASLLGLSALGWLGIPLTLFNVLALILVLGISVDYVLFFAETQASYQSTMLAVTLSAITTILSFGLLALSQTPVIHFFGVTVFVGITVAFLLSPIVVRLEKAKIREGVKK